MPHASERSECSRQVMRKKSCVSLTTHPRLFRPKRALDHARRMVQDQRPQQHLGAIGIHDMVGQRLPVLSIFRDVRRPSELKIGLGGEQRHHQRPQCHTHDGRCVSYATYLWSAARSQSPLPSAQQPKVWGADSIRSGSAQCTRGFMYCICASLRGESCHSPGIPHRGGACASHHHVPERYCC